MANDKRLIDADDFAERLKLMARVAYPNKLPGLLDAIDYVNDFITVDAVEVVRCRDCKWYMPGDLFTDTMFCNRMKKENGKPAKYVRCDDDFCSYGERKEGADNG